MELALVMPFLLLLVFGILEVSRLLETQHIISAITREGANLASRGTSMARTVEEARKNQDTSGLGSAGGIIVSRIFVEDEVPRVEAQESSEGAPPSDFFTVGEVATPYQGIDPPLLDDQTYYVVEMYVPYESFTPFPDLPLVGGIVPVELYDRSLF